MANLDYTKSVTRIAELKSDSQVIGDFWVESNS